MRLSKYTHLFQDCGKYYLFNAETLFISEIDKDLFEDLLDGNLSSITESHLSELRNQRIITDDNWSDIYFYNCKTKTLERNYDPSLLSLVIAPTTGCNFQCPYCFEPKKNPKTMSDEVEDSIVDYIKSKTHAKALSLSWYGGEPLLAFDRMMRLYDRIISETDKKIVSHDIITNGYLIDDRVIDFFKRTSLDSIQITFDGVKDTHDSKRFVKNGRKPTFDAIVANIRKLATSIPDLRIQIRVNVNKDNAVEFADIFRLFTGADWHANITVYPGIIHEDSEDGASMCSSCYTESSLHELYELLENAGIPVNYLPNIAGKGCMIHSTGAFIIGPEGELYKCWEDVSKPDRTVGSLMDPKKGDYGLMMRYMHECDAFNEDCKKCSVFPICWGGCGHRRYRNHFEGCEFELCSPLRDPELLKRVIMNYMRAGKPEAKKFISMF